MPKLIRKQNYKRKLFAFFPLFPSRGNSYLQNNKMLSEEQLQHSKPEIQLRLHS